MSNKVKNQGVLLVFEGIDHVGKSTISRKIYEFIKNKGIPCAYYSFPGKEKGTLGEIVYQIHHDKCEVPTSQISPTSLQILHIAAHIDAIERTILSDIRAGKIVILDRFWWSTYAYGIGNGLSERLIKQIIAPEISLLEEVQALRFIYIKRKARESDYTIEKSAKILTAYDFLCAEVPSGEILIIDNDGTIDEATEKIKDFIIEGAHK